METPPFSSSFKELADPTYAPATD